MPGNTTVRSAINTRRRPKRLASGVRARAPATAPTPWAVTSTDVPLAPSWKMLMATAGMRAMNGETSSAVRPIRPVARRQPGSTRRPRIPVTMRSRRLSSPMWGRAWRRVNSRATITAANEAAFSSKTKL